MEGKMSKGLRYYALLGAKFVSGLLVVLQIFGLLPALTWLSTPNAITTDLVLKLLIKLAALFAFYSVYRWSKSALSKIHTIEPTALSSGNSSQPSPPYKGNETFVLSPLGLLLLSLAMLIILCFSYFVWPTIYRYDTFSTGSGANYPIRTNRFTGESEILKGFHGWVSAAKAQTNIEQMSSNPPKSELKPESHPTTSSQEMSREEAISVLRSRHPDYESIRTSPEYGRWLRAQKPDIRRLANSSDPYEAIQLVDLYKGHMASSSRQ